MPMSDPACVVVVAPNWLGDAVMALPAIGDVRRTFPSARLVVAARRAVAEVFNLVPFVDERVTLQWNGRWWQWRAFAADAKRLRSLGADVAILLPNSFAAAWLARGAAIRDRWGYGSDMRSRLLSRVVRRPMVSMHQGAYYQHLTRELGIASGPLEPGVTVTNDALAVARQQLADRGWDGVRPVVVFASGAAYGHAKRWIPSFAARVVTDLVRQRQITCVMVGSHGDAATVREVVQAVEADAVPYVIDMTGQTTIPMLAGVLSVAGACVANDSGAMHLAAAVGTPLVALFGPTREEETAPLTRSGGRAEILIHAVSCRPCMLRECPIDHPCMTGITPERVYGALTSLLSSTP
jgi:heptosyltransferase-2